MRLRKVKGAEEKIINSNYVIQNAEIHKGNFKEIFSNNNPIYLEIGTGKGNFLIENAKTNPNINYIGIEKYNSVLVRALEKINDLELNNIKFICDDADNINNILSNEIEKLYLNFSDPWPKKRHAKRRLTSPEFLSKYEKIFLNKKNIEMKTDNRNLFEYSLKTLTNFEYKIDDISLDLYKDDIKNNIPTEYEEKFSKEGKTIYYISVIK